MCVFCLFVCFLFVCFVFLFFLGGVQISGESGKRAFTKLTLNMKSHWKFGGKATFMRNE